MEGWTGVISAAETSSCELNGPAEEGCRLGAERTPSSDDGKSSDAFIATVRRAIYVDFTAEEPEELCLIKRKATVQAPRR